MAGAVEGGFGAGQVGQGAHARAGAQATGALL